MATHFKHAPKRQAFRIQLGRGLYSLPEAASYIGENPQRMRYWFRSHARVSAPPLLHSEYGMPSGEVTLSFLDLVEAMVTHKWVAAGMTKQQIRRAYAGMQEAWRIDRPFAHRRLSTDGSRVFIHFGNEELVEVLTRQHFLETVWSPFLTHVTFDETTGMAAQWRPAEGVLLNPRVSFGKPVIEGTGTATHVVYRAWYANDRSIERVAELYDLTPEQVQMAVRYEEGLAKAA